MRHICALLFCVAVSSFFLDTPSFAAKGPDIPTRSKLYLENKSTSDESHLFTELFREKLTKDESKGDYSKPGFPVVDKKEEATYVLRFLFVLRENQRSFGQDAQEHARVNVWLLDSRGTVIWEHNYDCIRVFREPARECYQHISDDLKAAQVNAEGKRAGWLGWRKTRTAKVQDAAPTNTPAQEIAAPRNPREDVSVPSAKLHIESDPSGADIEIDGSFVGDTTSDVQVTEGEHTVSVKKTGFKKWDRKLTISGGSSVHLKAELERVTND